MTYHPRIHPVNYPLLGKLPTEHPAVRALQAHAEADEVCVGKEINWPNLGIKGVDQAWFSTLNHRETRFSSFAYQYISYDLFLDGWVESVDGATQSELSFLNEVPQLKILLHECEGAARAEQNLDILPLVAKARQFLDALEHAILYRFETVGIRYERGLSNPAPVECRPPEGFHKSIHPFNYSLLRELPPDHPAVRALQIHAAAREACVRTEIRLPRSGVVSIDQLWSSDLTGREERFSSFASRYLDYELLLDGWVESASQATETEIGFLDDATKMRILLDECDRSARANDNLEILPFVTKAMEFANALERAILFRFEIAGISPQHLA